MEKQKTLKKDAFSILEEEIKRKKLTSAHLVTEKITKFFYDFINSGKWGDHPIELLTKVKEYGKQLQEADKMNFVVPNTVKRVLHFIRKGCKQLRIDLDVDKQKLGFQDFGKKLNVKNKQKSHDDQEILFEENFSMLKEESSPKMRRMDRKSTLALSSNKLMTPNTSKSLAVSSGSFMSDKKRKKAEAKKKDFIQLVTKEIFSMQDDNEMVFSEITRQAPEHINTNDILLTFGESDMVFSFIDAAHKGVEDQKGKAFQVYVCETAPMFTGHKTAARMQEAGITCSLITDASVYALMSRVDKVVISTQAIMANGGLIAKNGAFQIALAAKEFSIPVIVVSAMYKLTPMYPFDPMSLNELLSPNTIMKVEDGDVPQNIEAIVPAYDYVAPDYISLYITNQGGFTPNYIYRQFQDNYSHEEKFDDCEDI